MVEEVFSVVCWFWRFGYIYGYICGDECFDDFFDGFFVFEVDYIGVLYYYFGIYEWEWCGVFVVVFIFDFMGKLLVFYSC